MIVRFSARPGRSAPPPVATVDGERLLDEDVLAVLEGGLGQLEVGPDRRHHGDGVDLRDVSNSDGSVVTAMSGYAACTRLRAAGFRSQTAGNVAPVEAVQVADNVRTPVAVAEHADADGHEGSFGASTSLRSLAGLPATIVRGGTSRVTTLPAPTIASSPISTPQRSSRRSQSRRRGHDGRRHRPGRLGLELAVARRRARETSLMNVTPWPTKT